MTMIAVWFIWEDDATMPMLFAFAAQQHGYGFTHLTTFAAATTLLPTGRPMVLIVDRSVETMDDGLAFCTMLRTQPTYATLPIIIGYADLGGKRFAEAYAVGANGCFGRVFDIAGIIRMIETVATNPSATGLYDKPEWQPRQKRSRT
jgi:CheY-like chemotaxis protein